MQNKKTQEKHIGTREKPKITIIMHIPFIFSIFRGLNDQT